MPNETAHPHETAIARLIAIMARLRDPDEGCAWDLQQTHETIVPYTIEEAYEVAEAVKSGNPDELKDELGDLLLQVVFQARIAEEANTFDFEAVAKAISTKMVRRHPHIFGETTYRNRAEQREAWEAIKAEERKEKNKSGILDGVATTLPPVMRAVKLQKRAGRVGFDWPDPAPVMAKIREELDEVETELAQGTDNKSGLEGEIGDLLFAVINLARKTGIDPDVALTRTNEKFINRFNSIEEKAKSTNQRMEDLSLNQMEEWWQQAKKR